jgi:RHS repeat-associated protein
LTQVLSVESNAYLYGLGRIGELQEIGFQYHLPDALDSVRQLIGSDSTVGFAQSHKPFGSMLLSAGVSKSSFGFTGQWIDTNALLYLRARYYEPNWGRFFQSDPWGGGTYQPNTQHAYVYGGNNPLLYIDPSGRCYGDFDFLRGIEPQNCRNLDMARTIFQSPETSAWEKAMAFGYATLWSTGHAAIGGLVAIGAATAPELAIGGAFIGGGYSLLKRNLAASGKCGCEAQQAVVSTSKWTSLRKGAVQGFLGGGLFGAGGVFGAIGEVVAGTAGFGLSGYGAGASITNMVQEGVNVCNALDLTASLGGMYLSGRYTYGKLPQVRVQWNQFLAQQFGGLGEYGLPPELQPPSMRAQWGNGGRSNILSTNYNAEGELLYRFSTRSGKMKYSLSQGEEAASLARARDFLGPREAFETLFGRPPGPNDFYRTTSVGTLRSHGFYPVYDAGKVVGGQPLPFGHVSVYVGKYSQWGNIFSQAFDYFGVKRPVLGP